MTPTRFFFARVAQAFGYFRRTQRMSEAANELHLLREAEAYLGEVVWENAEKIEDLSVEYWNLRKLNSKKIALVKQLQSHEELLSAAHEKRTVLFNTPDDDQVRLFQQRVDLLEELEELASQRDRVVEKARKLRRSYDGLKAKREVLTQESEHEQQSGVLVETLDEVDRQLAIIKEDFTVLKNERLRIAKKIEAGDSRIDAIDEKVKLKQKVQHGQTSQVFQHISEIHKEISSMRAEIGLLDTQMAQLHAEIGRHISRNASQSSLCADACKEYKALVEVMRALRRSISFNHRLAAKS